MRPILLVAIFALPLLFTRAFACDTFATSSTAFTLMAKAYDWQVGHGVATVNKRHVKKTALTISKKDQPLTWTSAYGSLTLTQFGREFPISGLNERGLAIETLWDFDSKFGNSSSAKPIVNEGQWLQYFLDTAGSVDDMVQRLNDVELRPVFAHIHYFACDATNACATFEFDHGKPTVHMGTSLPYKALTNSLYKNSLRYLKDYQGFGGDKSIPIGSTASNDRFVLVTDGLKGLNATLDPMSALTTSFYVMSTVRDPKLSMWQMVHDLKNRVTHYRVLSEGDAVHEIDLNQFDFSCKTPVKNMNMLGAREGDVTGQFKDYDADLNRETIRKSVEAIGLPEELIDLVANYPDSTTCTEP